MHVTTYTTLRVRFCNKGGSYGFRVQRREVEIPDDVITMACEYDGVITKACEYDDVIAININ